MTLQALDELRQQQAASMAFFDVSWLFAVVSLGLVLLVQLMKRSVAAPGERIGGEKACDALRALSVRSRPSGAGGVVIACHPP